MLTASILATPPLCHQDATADSFPFDPPRGNRAPRVGGVGGSGQPLRGTWRPMFLQPTTPAPRAAPVRVVQIAQVDPPISAGWWRGFLQSLGLAAAAPALRPASQRTEPFGGEARPEQHSSPDPALHLPDVSEADAAASFWEEHMMSPGENVQVYGPVEPPETTAAAREQRIGRSFLGAYRKGRRAAEAGLNANHCPYKSRLEPEGRPTNALTRTFQRHWAEGLNDALNGGPSRYV